jgi:hypothetical protein
MTVIKTNRRYAVRDPWVRAAIDETLAMLRSQLARLDADIDAAVRAPPVWREAEDLLTSVSSRHRGRFGAHSHR